MRGATFIRATKQYTEKSLLRLTKQRFYDNVKLVSKCAVCLANRRVRSPATKPKGQRLKWRQGGRTMGDVWSSITSSPYVFRRERIRKIPLILLHFVRPDSYVKSLANLLTDSSTHVRMTSSICAFLVKSLPCSINGSFVNYGQLRPLDGCLTASTK